MSDFFSWESNLKTHSLPRLSILEPGKFLTDTIVPSDDLSLDIGVDFTEYKTHEWILLYASRILHAALLNPHIGASGSPCRKYKSW